jgi:hypothetical protein
MKYDMVGIFPFPPPNISGEIHYPKVPLKAGAPPPQSFHASYAPDEWQTLPMARDIKNPEAKKETSSYMFVIDYINYGSLLGPPVALILSPPPRRKTVLHFCKKSELILHMMLRNF